MELSLSAEMYVLSSVTGTSRMAAYVTMMLDESPIGICFAVGGEGFQVRLSSVSVICCPQGVCSMYLTSNM